jgi:hypothetical protein
VLLRLLALLMSLGMIFISSQARDYAPVEVAAVVDISDEVPYDLVVSATLPAPEPSIVKAPTDASQPVSYRYESSVFRPPRAALA